MACYICGQFNSTLGTAHRHIRIVQGYDITGRSRGVSRPREEHYNYVMRMAKHTICVHPVGFIVHCRN